MLMLGLATVVRRADVERLDFHPDLTRIRVWVVYLEYLQYFRPAEFGETYSHHRSVLFSRTQRSERPGTVAIFLTCRAE